MTNKNKDISKKESDNLTSSTDNKKVNTYSKTKIKFVQDEESKFSLMDYNNNDVRQSFINAFGTKDIDVANRLMSSLAFVLGNGNQPTDNDLNFAIAYLQDFNPKDSIEAMLAIQMLGTTIKSTNCIGKANLSNQTFEGETENINRTTKLNRTFIAQMDALKRYRSQGSQKITVEHINVNEGGKAVIGSTINNQINNNSD